MNLRTISPAAVKAMLTDGGEIALVDVREELTFSQSHLLWARCIPLSRLELRFAHLVPRLDTRIVLCDDNDGLVERAAAILERAGYTDVAKLDGGTHGWEKAGFELFSGVNVPSKAFGEYIEHACETPSISPEELDALLNSDTDMIVVDSRPFDEFQRVSLPTAINVPGAELVLRIYDIAPSPETLVVVNCAGRTRSIIGAQSLINAGIANKVVALRNGTMGWQLAGHAAETGQDRPAPRASIAGLARARTAVDAIRERYGITRIDRATLKCWQDDAATHTLYLLDVRDPAEYVAGHLPGALPAPGGQLVQATDQYIGTLRSRIVLVDDIEVRAVMTASWLVQMGWENVSVLAEAGAETGPRKAPVLGRADRLEDAIEVATLADLLSRNDATVIDLSLSRTYRRGHIPGAWFAIRSRLDKAKDRLSVQGTIVFTSEDGVLAALAVEEARSLWPAPVRYLAGGNAAWQRDGHGFEPGEDRMADEPVDIWLKPYERTSGTRAAMSDYLAWEVDLLDRIARDGSCRFTR